MSRGPVEVAWSPRGLTTVLLPSATATSADLAAALADAVAGSAPSVVVDARHLAELDWEGFDALREAHERLAAHGRRLLVVHVLPGPAGALELVDTGRQLTVVTLERVPSRAWTEAGALEP